MDRRQFIAFSASVTLAGCVGSDVIEGPENSESGAEGGDEGDVPAEDESEKDEPEKDEPEPEGGDGRPYTHYDLDVHNERSAGQPVWVDQGGRMYGRWGPRVTVSDDRWETTDVLYSFESDGEHVEMVLVPDNGRILVAIGGQGETGGRIELLDEDLDGSETLYQFEYGRVSNSMGHAVHENIIVISCYERSNFEANDHANEVILSTDGGESFELILETELATEDAANHHIHDVEYDPFAERIWVAVGDHGNSQIYWSDDLGESWTELGERGAVTMITQVAAFEECVVFGTDSSPEGIIRWERDGPDDEPNGVSDLVRPHVQIETDPNDDTMEMYARRRWHVREDDGRELCLMPFGYSPMHETASESVVLASVDGNEWYELYRVDGRETLLTNIMGPLSIDGDRQTLVSDSNQGDGHQIDATVPKFWE